MPRPVRTLVAGVDGCPGGWVVALLDAHSSNRVDHVDIRVVASFRDVLALGARVVAVDIPVGLPAAGTRACDVEARQYVGPRRSSVFPAPPRLLLSARSSYEAAAAASRDIDGRGLSRQAFNLLPKIAEVDAALTPGRQRRVVEAFPEASFAAMAGAPMAWPKRRAAGRAERLQVIHARLGEAAQVAAEARPARGARPDDVLDALALAWTARRVTAGGEIRLGDRARDERGLRMQVVV